MSNDQNSPVNKNTQNLKHVVSLALPKELLVPKLQNHTSAPIHERTSPWWAEAGLPKNPGEHGSTSTKTEERAIFAADHQPKHAGTENDKVRSGSNRPQTTSQNPGEHGTRPNDKVNEWVKSAADLQPGRARLRPSQSKLKLNNSPLRCSQKKSSWNLKN